MVRVTYRRVLRKSARRNISVLDSGRKDTIKIEREIDRMESGEPIFRHLDRNRNFISSNLQQLLQAWLKPSASCLSVTVHLSLHPLQYLNT